MARKKVAKKKTTRRSAGQTKVAKKTPRKKVATAAAAQKSATKAAPADERAAIPRSPLKSEELADFRNLLIAKRQELVGDMQHMTSEALRDASGNGGNLSNVPIHMADVGSDNWEQEFTLGLLETERQLLREIDAALERIDQGSYGVCEATHKPISKRRLRAQPWARYCIEYARSQENNRRR